MFLKKSFNKLLYDISLDKTRKKRIKSAHRHVRNYLLKSEKLKEIIFESYLQGSYRQGTAIKPIDESEFDVDVVLTFNWRDDDDEMKDFLKLKNKLIDAIKDNDTISDKLEKNPGKRCITLDYTGDFHLDILPCHRDADEEEIIWVRNTSDTWKESNPKGYYNWITKKNKESNKNLKPIIKIMKFWRNLQFGEEFTLKSIVLSTIVGKCISNNSNSLDVAFVETIENLLKTYRVKKNNVPKIYNPSLKDENLSDKLTLNDYNRFIKLLKKAAPKARQAVNLKTDIKKAIDLWNSSELFRGKLPNTSLEDQAKIDEAIQINNSIKDKNVNVGISSFGILKVKEKDNVNEAIYSKHHRKMC